MRSRWPRRSWRSSPPMRAMRGRAARRELIASKKKRVGGSNSPRWITRTTTRARRGTPTAARANPERMSPRQAWRAIVAGLPRDAIISSDIGNNCAIGNAYPTFEQGRKYLAPGLFGPCGYGFPSIIGAKIGNPDDAGRRLRRRRRLRHLDERDDLDRARAVAGHHDGDLPQLPVGRGKAQLDAVVRQQFRRHRA